VNSSNIIDDLFRFMTRTVRIFAYQSLCRLRG